MANAIVTIAMPVRNGATTLGPAVRSLLRQTSNDWELILIDDGSTDETVEKANQFRDERIKVLRDGTNKGLPVRLNEALAMAAGHYTARMDADDVSYPDRLAAQVAYLDSHPSVDLTGASVLVFGEQGRVLGKRTAPERHQDIVSRPYAGFPMAHPTFLGRTAWFRSWLFRPAAGGACDQDLLFRSHATSTFANIPDILLGYREEAVMLRKVLQYRVEFARSLIAHFGRSHVISLSRGLSLAAAKSAADAIAVGTGLQHRLLRHRARPVDPAEAAAWADVWRLVGAPD